MSITVGFFFWWWHPLRLKKLTKEAKIWPFLNITYIKMISLVNTKCIFAGESAQDM